MRLIIFTVAWALGISVARALSSIQPSAWLTLIFVTAVAGLILGRRLAWWVPVVLIAFAAGCFRQSLLPHSSDIAQHNGHSGTITGLVVSQPKLREDIIQVRLESETIFVNSRLSETSGLVLVEADPSAAIEYGDRIRATGRLEIPASWDSFSYADYLGRQGVFSVMRNAGLEVVGAGHGNALLSTLIRLRLTVQRHIASALPEPQAGLLTGILLGDEDGISPALKDAFSRVGASHVVAISGFNMVVVSGIVIRVLSSAFRRNKTVVTLNLPSRPAYPSSG